MPHQSFLFGGRFLSLGGVLERDAELAVDTMCRLRER